MTCKDCIHYDICVFHLKGNENEKCLHFKSTVDIKTEVAREIFAEIEKMAYLVSDEFDENWKVIDCDDIAELKNKYTKEGVGELKT